MANIKSAKKRILVNETKAARNKAIESVLYYGGRVSGICAVFSSISKVAGMEVKTIFTSADLPDYQVYNSHECELCKEGQKLTGLINSFGFVEL